MAKTDKKVKKILLENDFDFNKKLKQISGMALNPDEIFLLQVLSKDSLEKYINLTPDNLGSIFRRHLSNQKKTTLGIRP